MPHKLNLYLVTWKNGGGWDTYDSFVVCCETEDVARLTHPGAAPPGIGQGWPSLTRSLWISFEKRDDLIVKKIGEAVEGMEPDVVCNSFNPG